MNRHLPGLTALFAVISLAAPAPAAEETPSSIRIGMVRSFFPNLPAPTVQILIQPFKSLLEAQGGLPAEIVAVDDPYDLARQLVDKKLHVGLFHGHEFAWARQKYPQLKPLVSSVNQQQTLHGYLVVKEDDPAQSFADVKGQTLALPLATRSYARVFFDGACKQLGDTPEKLFQVCSPADIEDALDQVVDGKVRCCVVDSTSLARFEKNKPGRFRQLKMAVESDVFPAAVVAYVGTDLSEAFLNRYRVGLQEAAKTRRGQQLLMLCRTNGFEPVNAAYEKQLSHILQVYPAPAAKER